jgi:CRP-like cAMP-binding protein
MPYLNEPVSAKENRLLAILPRQERERLAPHLRTVSLALKTVLYEADEPITYVYFPRRGLAVSAIVFMENGSASEVGTVGFEGMAGLPVFLGADTSTCQAIIQVPGEALRMRASTFREEIGRLESLVELLQRYTQAYMGQIMQSAACNDLHTVEERMCRWLLMTHDRVESDVLPLTQEFLAVMLGVRRPSVTVVAGVLQRSGLIRYQRGKITVLDRAGLEKASCECYHTVRKQFTRLLGEV